MATRLRNIRIDEVSSVDKGAGLGVEVVLIKRQADEAALSATEKALAKVFRSVLGDDADAATISVLTKAFQQFRDHDQESDMPITLDKDALTKLIGEQIAKALTDAGVGIIKMTPEHEAYHNHLDGDEAKKFSAMTHDERAKHIKAHPIATEGKDNNDGESAADEESEKRLVEKMLEVFKAGRKDKKKKPAEEADEGEAEKRLVKAEADAKKREDALQKRIESLEGDKQKIEFGKRAVALGFTEADGEQLLKAHRGDPVALKWLEDQYSALRKQADAGALFSEFGTIEKGRGGKAHDELVAKAAELRKTDPKLTVEQAYVKALEDPANAEIAKRERQERSAAINGRQV